MNRSRWWYPLLLAALGIAVYSNSFFCAYQFDDYPTLMNNPWIRLLLFPKSPALYTNRPATDLTFALNFLAGRFNSFSYHVVNLAIHLAAALVLFGIVRRTLTLPRLRPRTGDRAAGLALLIAGIWAAHPLQTESVTYITQRAESLMGFFLLLALYSVIRSAETGRAVWKILAVSVCMLGMATKPVMVIAPVLIALYDRIFLCDSWGALWRARAKLYLGLAASWLVLLQVLWVSQSGGYPETAGFRMVGITPWNYAFTQPAVILHYLRLSFWPHPLVFDYLWPTAHSWRQIWPGWTVLAALAAATGIGLRRFPRLAFLGLWFFLTLAPTSSVFPLADLAVEHRMYLPLAAVAASVVLGADALIGTWPAVLGTGMAILLALGLLTFQRNEAYQTPESLWRDTVGHRPANPRAHCNLGILLGLSGKTEEAEKELRAALRLSPGFAEAHENLAALLHFEGRTEEALSAIERAIQLKPHSARFHDRMGLILEQKGDREEAANHYRESIRLDPAYLPAQKHLREITG